MEGAMINRKDATTTLVFMVLAAMMILIGFTKPHGALGRFSMWLLVPGWDERSVYFALGAITACVGGVLGLLTMVLNYSMTQALLVIAVIALYVLHQDFWFWRTAYFRGGIPFGFIPIGLFYQACFSAAAALLMWLLVKFAWPSHLERVIEQKRPEEDATS